MSQIQSTGEHCCHQYNRPHTYWWCIRLAKCLTIDGASNEPQLEAFWGFPCNMPADASKPPNYLFVVSPNNSTVFFWVMWAPVMAIA